MFKILDIISWVGIIIVAIYLILEHQKVLTWKAPFTMILGSILFLVGQFLLVLHFKTVRGPRFHYITVDDVHKVYDIYTNYLFWVIMLVLLVFVSIKKYIKK